MRNNQGLLLVMIVITLAVFYMSIRIFFSIPSLLVQHSTRLPSIYFFKTYTPFRNLMKYSFSIRPRKRALVIFHALPKN